MARKHRRRTRKRNKRGGFAGPEFSKKFSDGLQGLDDLRKGAQQRAKSGIEGMNKAAFDIKQGFDSRTAQAGSLQMPVPQPPSSPPPMNPVKEKHPSLESPYEQSPYEQSPYEQSSYEQSIETNQPTKEKQGGLLGLGTWFGLGGRRLSHSSFINKMLRVRNKTKRNKAIRKYLKGGKKKTKRKRKRKNKTKKRRRRR